MSRADRDRGARAGVYNGLTLRLYDAGVLGLTNSWIWRCTTARQVEHYNRNAGGEHLDIGPGTGFYLERIESPSVTLLDLNPACLDATEERIGSTREVRRLQQSFFDEIPDDQQFDSIGMSFLLHCIPGVEKWQRLAELRKHLRPGGRMFGSTVVLERSSASLLARVLNGVYGYLGVFGNAADTAHDLEQALDGLEDVRVERVGQVLLFSATNPTKETL